MRRASTVESSVEHTSIGRIVVPPGVPDGFRLFYTTIDYDGGIVPELIDAPIAECRQVHGAAVRCAARASDAPQCDALWTAEKHLALAIKVADCLPVSLIDAAHGVIANIHSGWRGTVQGIAGATLDAAPLDPAATTAWLGPTIRVCCFEVGEEVALQFDERFVDRSRGAKPHVDIALAVADLLHRRGVANVIDTGLCTRCQGSMFHSYRRDKRSGRNLAIVAH